MSARVAVIAGLFLVWSGICFYLGGLPTKLSDARKDAKEATHEAAKANADAPIIAQEAEGLAHAKTDDIAPAVAPRLSVCYYRTPPAPPASRPLPDGGAPVRGPGGGGADVRLDPAVREFDTQPLVRAAREADAQVSGLQDYIKRVCLAP